MGWQPDTKKKNVKKLKAIKFCCSGFAENSTLLNCEYWCK